MNYKLVTALSVLTVAVLAGCNNARSPGAVANDVAAAQQKAAENVTRAKTSTMSRRRVHTTSPWRGPRAIIKSLSKNATP